MKTPNARVSVVEQVWFQSTGEQPHALNMRMFRPLETNEQCYTRRKTVGEKPEQLDTGWVVNPSFVIVENEEGKHNSVIPSPSEKSAVATKVLYLFLGEVLGGPAQLMICPGEHLRLPLVPGTNVWIWSGNGNVRATVHAIPSDNGRNK